MELRAGYKETEVGGIPEDWGARLLSQELDGLEAGVSVNSIDEQIQAVPHDVFILKTSAVANGSFIPSEIKKVSPRDLRRVRTHARADTIIFSRMNTPDLVGESGYVDRDYPNFFLPDRLWMTRFKRESKVCVKWLSYLLNSQKYKTIVRAAATGTSGSMKNISKGALTSILLPWPDPEEQRTIAAALSDADALIASLDALIDKKRDLKQAAMQQLLTGKARLPGFTSEWETKRLGEIGRALIGLTYRPSDIRSSGTLVLRSSNIQNGALAFDDNVFVEPNAALGSIVEVGDLLVCARNGSRDLIGKSVRLDERARGMAFGAFMAAYRSEFNNFLSFQFQSDLIKRQINEHLGATINQITNKSLLSFQVLMPSDRNEQTAIAEVLSDIDADLTTLEARREKAHVLKQGMMQELLTGRIRLV